LRAALENPTLTADDVKRAYTRATVASDGVMRDVRSGSAGNLLRMLIYHLKNSDT